MLIFAIFSQKSAILNNFPLLEVKIGGNFCTLFFLAGKRIYFCGRIFTYANHRLGKWLSSSHLIQDEPYHILGRSCLGREDSWHEQCALVAPDDLATCCTCDTCQLGGGAWWFAWREAWWCSRHPGQSLNDTEREGTRDTLELETCLTWQRLPITRARDDQELQRVSDWHFPNTFAHFLTRWVTILEWIDSFQI